ncbi:hypothetical protein RvY_14842 [Ramazzottius varieornatus]|uniref:Uncharacterized protein n=1 Tax=Ramazzottius varieornatus TaxID=947166 RepID=A0A1D1VSQ4_RAMVA|nr:hypothetical protein RvY_14842 [Ramazzottius varieornatus]
MYRAPGKAAIGLDLQERKTDVKIPYGASRYANRAGGTLALNLLRVQEHLYNRITCSKIYRTETQLYEAHSSSKEAIYGKEKPYCRKELHRVSPPEATAKRNNHGRKLTDAQAPERWNTRK